MQSNTEDGVRKYYLTDTECNFISVAKKIVDSSIVIEKAVME